MALYDVLKSKTSKELKSFLIDDNCSPEMTEVATQILHERNESIDDLLYSEPVSSIDSESKETQSTDNTEEEKIKGWFFLFLAYICLEAFLNVLHWRLGWTNPNFRTPAIGALELLYLVGLASYLIELVVKRKPNAIFWCKTTLGYFIAISCLNLLICHFDSINFNIIHRIFTICAATAWLLYIRFSKQVNRIFPKEKRKVLDRDKAFLTMLIIPYLLGFFAGIVKGFENARNNDINQNTPVVITSTECTDGVITFSIPYGHSCEVKNDEAHTFLSVTQYDRTVVASSGFIPKYSEDELNTIAEDIFKKLREGLQLRGTETNTLSVFDQRDNLYIFHKKYSYSNPTCIDNVQELDAYILFCRGTNKYAVVRDVHPIGSSYSKIEDVVNSLRFR